VGTSPERTEPSAPTATRGSQKFPKSLRLTTRREFLKVQDRGFKVNAEPLLGLALTNGLGFTRLGITVSSKVGNAVVRTRIRRKLREVFRKRRGELPVGLDVVIIARSGAKEADLETLGRAFGVIAGRLRSRRW